MRAKFLVACASVALGAGIACASAEAEEVAAPDTELVPIVADAALDSAVDDATVIDPPAPSTCSAAGWCLTTLPDADLVLIDIWPLQGRAFAVAVSPSIGAKVLEWIEADQRWTYIDDNTQNENGFGRYVGRIWAPSEDEVYYTVEPGYVYRGKRGATWTWERELLVPASVRAAGRDTSAPVSLLLSPTTATLGVWGTSADDVYAWRADTIYHRKSVDGGAAEWVEDYVGPALPDRMVILAAGGTDKDDVWFSGGSGGTNSTTDTCPMLMRKSPEGYRTVVAGTYTRSGLSYSCPPRPSTVGLTGPGATSSTHRGDTGAMTDVFVRSDGEVAALRFVSTLTRLIPEDGGYRTTSEKLFSPGYTLNTGIVFSSLWVNGEDAWLSGPGFVLQGPVSGDAGAFGVSTLALTGAPVNEGLHRIRGTDASNIWAIGDRYAYHKTAP